MLAIENEGHDKTRDRTGTQILLWGGVLAGCFLVLAALVLARRPSLPTEIPDPPAPTVIHRAPPGAKFYDEGIAPEIEAVDKLNRQAAERCVRQIRDSFASYRAGIEPFADELTSFGTRFGVLRRMPGDWWYEREWNKKFIRSKFEKHLLSEAQLNSDIQDALNTFRVQLDANKSTLLTNVRTAISASDLPDIVVEYGDFSAEISKDLREFAGSAAEDNLNSFLITEIASGAGGAVAAKLVVVVSASIVSATAASTTVAGGATAGTTTGGTAAGSVGGPAVAVVGAAVGLVAGLAIDWRMTERFKSKLETGLNQMFDEVESAVIFGDDDQPGLRQTLDEACDAIRDAYRSVLYDRIVIRRPAK